MDRQKKLFPQRLWELVNDPRYDNCLRWSHDGQKVYLNRNEFEQQYLSSQQNQFHTQKAISFVRQMNMYGFRKVDESYYENDHFKRDYPHLLKNMVRRNPNRNSTVMHMNATSNQNNNIASTLNHSLNHASPASNHSQGSSDNDHFQHHENQDLNQLFLHQDNQQQHHLQHHSFQGFTNVPSAQLLLEGSATTRPLTSSAIKSLIPNSTSSAINSTLSQVTNTTPIHASSANNAGAHQSLNNLARSSPATATTLSNPSTPPARGSLTTPTSPSTSGATHCLQLTTSTKNLLEFMKLHNNTNDNAHLDNQLTPSLSQQPLVLPANQQRSQQQQQQQLLASRDQQQQQNQLVQALAAATCTSVASNQSTGLSVSPTTLWGSLCQSMSPNHLNLAFKTPVPVPPQLLTEQHQQKSQSASTTMQQNKQPRQQQYDLQERHHKRQHQQRRMSPSSELSSATSNNQAMMNNNFLSNLDHQQMIALSHGLGIVNGRNQTNANYASANEAIARAAATTNSSLQMALMQNHLFPSQITLVEAVRNQAMLENAVRSINFQQQQQQQQQNQNIPQNQLFQQQATNQLFSNPNINQMLTNPQDPSSLLLTASLSAALAALSQATTTTT